MSIPGYDYVAAKTLYINYVRAFSVGQLVPDSTASAQGWIATGQVVPVGSALPGATGNIPISPVAPDPSVQPVWADSSTSPPTLKGWTGSAWTAYSGGGGGGAVSSVFTRTGSVVAASGDYTADQIADGTTNRLYTATEKTKLAAITGTNTGDETATTIKSKLSISTLSGSNTGDQTLPTTLPPNGSAGGDLTGTYPNPTLAVDRITKALLTTKGDVIAASAASTPARVPVGSNGTVLTADSTQTAGVKWAASAGGGGAVMSPNLVSGRYIVCGVPGVVGANTLSSDLTFVPFVVDRTITVASIAVDVAGAGAGSTTRLGIYADTAGLPGALVVDAGTIDTTTTGVKEATLSTSLTPGRYWAAISCDRAGSPSFIFTSTPYGSPLATTSSTTAFSYNVAAYFGSGLTFTDPAPSVTDGYDRAPRILIKVS